MNELNEKLEREKIGKDTALVSPAGCRTEMMMNLKLWMVALFLLATVGLLGGCATSSGDADPDPDDPVTMPEPDPDPEPDPEPEPDPPTDLEIAQNNAATAAMNAETAANNAKAAAEAAEMAGDMHATLQTGDDGYKLYLEAANDAYQEAMTAYNEAKKQSAAAKAATELVDAVTAAVKAETAQADAETAQTAAEEARDKAMMAANDLLKIDDTVKSVGGSMVDATTGKNTVTTNGQTMVTGLLSEPTTSGAETDGRAAVNAMPLANPAVAYVSPRVNAESRGTVKIGKMLDTSDDAARLTIITHYAGTKTVEVFAATADDDLTGTVTSDGRIQTAGADTPAINDDVFVTLKPVGTYYRAGADGTLDPMGRDNSVPPEQQGDTVADDAKGVTVYSHTAGPDGVPDNTDDAIQYVVLESTMTDTDGTTAIYNNAVIHVLVDRDGDGIDDNVEVTARIPDQAAYEHVHFGAWASLGDAKANGDQSPSDLGIGFVQSIGDGLTGDDMPNNGEAFYSGNWAATIQEADTDGDGAMSMTTGQASVFANFTKAEITATLFGLATLSGDIADNTFSGTKANATGGGLDLDGDFTGSFSGGFYGAKAEEAAGVFNFTSDGDKDGAFSGAFGGRRN